jgi:hypothetical protein
MVHQATVMPQRNASGKAPTHLARNASSVVRDLCALTELQARLLAADYRESRRRLLVATILLVVGSVALLASLPVALTALAEWFLALGLGSRALAYWCATGVGLLLAAVLLVVGQRSLRNSLRAFQRSKTEFVRNVEWIRSILVSDQTYP